MKKAARRRLVVRSETCYSCPIMGKHGFEPRLESLRGIAALIVAVSHGMSAFQGEPGRFLDAAAFVFSFINAGAAVCFFFVLSGYVLGRSLASDFSPVQFYIRRVFRIFPALVVSVLVAYVLRNAVEIGGGFSASFTEAFSRQLTASDLIDNVLLRSFAVNGPSWSIYPEMIGSIFLPILVFAHLKATAKWQWPLFVAVSVALSFSDLRMLLWFYFGFFLPGRIAPLLRNDLARIAAFVGGYVLLLHTVDNETYFKVKTLLPTSLAVSLMLAAILSDDAFLSVLRMRPLRFLGRISYSLYLLHWPIFFATASLVGWAGFGGMTGNALVCTFSISATIAASAVSYSLIERAGMKCALAIVSLRSPAAHTEAQSTAAGN